ncbi:dTDP-4-dehydrorhamnose reductase [Massilia niastensis]|uniref:dTDP-4-dehydrorhamnose reductase n=1 Tax=Massilia niastensis TaxID=544911 RepID=UPI000363E7E8|nr:dTDP-4-dehydrorhamnose reductase [Massilia niastensis]
MKILLTGVNGQVGYELLRCLQGLGEIVACDRARLDLANLDQVRDAVRAVRPALIVNAAAYTAVDRAESEPELALRINAQAPGVMALQARDIGATLVHFSTDYVFDGAKDGPYVEGDRPRPLNVYGETKMLGEQAIVSSGIPHLILRTGWVYGMRGHNFLRTMLRLAAERDEVRVVADQVGAPTWCRTVAQTTAHILAQAQVGGPAWWRKHRGLYHLSAQGETSWAGFAEAIMQESGSPCRVVPIGTADYPAQARRPVNSRLDSSRLMQRFCQLPDWREALALCMR